MARGTPAGQSESAYWWTLGTGVVLGTLGAIAASRSRYPAAPVVTYPYPAAQTYDPAVVACPGPWVRVEVPS